jgi:hypothetical protein
MIIVRLLSPGPWLVGTTKVYPGVGADIVMESITLINLRQPAPLTGNPPDKFQELAWLPKTGLHFLPLSQLRLSPMPA